MTGQFYNLTTKERKLLLSERLKTMEDFTSSFYNLLPNPSKLLQRHGVETVFSETAADTTVRGAVNTIFEGIGSLEWEIVNYEASDLEVELAYDTMERLMTGGLIKKILYAVFYGFQPLNVIWKYEGDKMVIDKLIEMPHDAIVFDKERNVRVVTSIGDLGGSLVEDYRLLLPLYDATYLNPYGTGLFLNCYKYVFIKNNISDFWTIFAEDYGSPGVKGSFTQAAASMFGMSPEKFVTYFYGKIEEMRGKKIIVHPEGTDIALIPGAGNVSAEIYSALIQYCKNEINTLILGHESASSATPGKLGNEQMAKSAKIDRIESYTEFITNYANELLKWQHELNFGTSGDACGVRFYEKDDIEVYTGRANLVNQLAAVGVQFNEDYFEDEFNIDKKYFKVVEPQRVIPFSALGKNGTTFNKGEFMSVLAQARELFAKDKKGEEDIVGEFMNFVLDSKEYNDANEAIYEDITKELDKFDTLEEMNEKLYDVYDKLDIENKKDIVSKFMLISAIYGFNQQKEGE